MGTEQDSIECVGERCEFKAIFDSRANVYRTTAGNRTRKTRVVVSFASFGSWMPKRVELNAATILLALSMTAAAPKMSVLMIIVDDLRSELLDDHGVNLLKTPHIDALAARGTRFRKAYAQYPLCAPSRSSVFTGLRPDTTRSFDLSTHFRVHVPMVVTLPQYFRREGYRTIGIGKVFHRGLGDDIHSWSEPQAK